MVKSLNPESYHPSLLSVIAIGMLNHGQIKSRVLSPLLPVSN